MPTWCEYGAKGRYKTRSIKHLGTMAKLPLAQEVAESDLTGKVIIEAIARVPAAGSLLASQRNARLIVGTGTG